MTNSDWWSRRLTNPPATQAPQAPYLPPVQQPAQQYAPVEQQAAPPRLPASATNTSRCPGCGSGNYGSASPEARPRCYDCGYPISQTGTGTVGITGSGGGASAPAKQVPTGGWNPTAIIGRID